MPRAERVRSATKASPFNYWQRLKEISLFFQGKDEVHKTMRRLVRRLERAGISYAVAGGMAVNAHRYIRTTGDVDVLLAPAGLAQFRRRFVPRNYRLLKGFARRFVDRVNNVTIDILVAGDYPGSGDPGPIAFPNPADTAERIGSIQVMDLPTLIQLKLATCRHKHFGDVVELIHCNNLNESFADKLHPSVRDDYIECLEEKRRDDVYRARKG